MSLQTTKRILELDGMRGIAIAMVLISHLFRNNVALEGGFQLSASFLLFCDQGVDVFFVLSGFLIGGILLRLNKAGDTVSAFYVRRAFRILPVYWLLLGSALLLPLIDRPLRFGLISFYGESAHPFWTYVLFVQNIAISISREWGADWLAVTWSLAVEEQFYLFAPWVIGRTSARTLVAGCIALMVICPVARWVAIADFQNPLAAYTLLICRADSLAMGVLAAVMVHNDATGRLAKCSRWLALGGVSLLALEFLKPAFGDSVKAVASSSVYGLCAGLFLLFAVTNRQSGWAAFLRFPPLVFLGSVSYFVYLFHLPVIYTVRVAMGNLQWNAPLFSTVAPAALVIAAAYVSRNRIERPLIRLGHSLTRAPDEIS